MKIQGIPPLPGPMAIAARAYAKYVTEPATVPKFNYYSSKVVEVTISQQARELYAASIVGKKESGDCK
jgi:hypothetical protein